jgi:hypothetical protein
VCIRLSFNFAELHASQAGDSNVRRKVYEYRDDRSLLLDQHHDCSCNMLPFTDTGVPLYIQNYQGMEICYTQSSGGEKRSTEVNIK